MTIYSDLFMSKHSILLILTSSLCLIALVLMSFFWFLRTRFITTSISSSSVLILLVLRLMTLLEFSRLKSSGKVSPAPNSLFLPLVYTSCTSRGFLELLNSFIEVSVVFYVSTAVLLPFPAISAALSRSPLESALIYLNNQTYKGLVIMNSEIVTI